jgi:hypothetical protein
MSSSKFDDDVRVLLAQAANFARRENYADAVARAEEARRSAEACGDTSGAELATQALAVYSRAFESWNEAIAKRRALRVDNAAYDEKKTLPPPPSR